MQSSLDNTGDSHRYSIHEVTESPVDDSNPINPKEPVTLPVSVSLSRPPGLDDTDLDKVTDLDRVTDLEVNIESGGLGESSDGDPGEPDDSWQIKGQQKIKKAHETYSVQSYPPSIISPLPRREFFASHNKYNYGHDHHRHTHHHYRRPVAGGIILDPKFQHILLIRGRESRKWGVPKGGIDLGEEPLKAGVREIWEETGLSIDMKVWMAPCVTYRRAKLFLFAFPRDVVQSQIKVQDTKEISDCRWFRIDKLGALERKTMMLKNLIQRMDHIKQKLQVNLKNYRVLGEARLTVNFHLNILLTEYAKASILPRDALQKLEEKFPKVFYKPEIFKVLRHRGFSPRADRHERRGLSRFTSTGAESEIISVA